MKKTTKIFLIISVIMLSLIALSSIVFAESTTYTSYLNMLSGNTTLKGSTRQYNQRNHEISYTVTQLDAPTVMYTSLEKDGFFSDTTVYEQTVEFNSANQTYTYYMGNHDTGKYYYYFSTFGLGHCGAFYAEPVNMKCYD